MTIETVNQLETALNTHFETMVIGKASQANAVAGQHHSLWLATGLPSQGVAPTAVAVPNNTTSGGFNFKQPVGDVKAYISNIDFYCANATSTLEIHDRLAHMGGLSGTVTTAQTVNMDLSTLLATSNLDARKGDANYSDVQWWLECFVQMGGTAANATINVTYNDGTTGNLTVFSLGTTLRVTRLISLNSYIPLADSGKYIRGINNVTLSVSTTVAGNFGFTATRYRAAATNLIANRPERASWPSTGLPELIPQSCPFPVILTPTTSTGILNANVKIIRG